MGRQSSVETTSSTYKKFFATRLNSDLIKSIRILSIRTEIPTEKLADEAFRDLLKKYEKK